jgi:uncharacterized hydrophobic protein (TIGR00271 family)
MSFTQALFKTTSNEHKEAAVKKLIENSFPSADFYLMVVLSVAMASFGLIMDSAAIIIGSMLIAPVLYPILSTAMGFIIFNDTLTLKSAKTLIKSMVVAIATAFVIGLIFGDAEFVRNAAEIQTRTSIGINHILVAIVAGLASAFALVKPKMSETLPGIAISVSLVPPLAVTGVGLAIFDLGIAKGSFSLFIVNVIGVLIASALVFSLMNFYTVRKGATKAIVEEEAEAEVREHALAAAKEQEDKELEEVKNVSFNEKTQEKIPVEEMTEDQKKDLKA